MSLVEHAKREFAAAGYIANDPEEGPDKWIQENVLSLLAVFASQGHSGMSAPYCVSMFAKLARYEPLVPLNGTDDEWMEVSNGLWQNRRCSHVFKDASGAWDLDGKVFVEPDGCAYTNSDSKVPVAFPYSPTTERVNVPQREREEPNSTATGDASVAVSPPAREPEPGRVASPVRLPGGAQ